MKKYKLLFTKIAPIALAAATVAAIASRDKNGRCHLDLSKACSKPSSKHFGQGSYENPSGVFISSHMFECLLGDTDAEAMARSDSTFITKQATTKLLRSSEDAGSYIAAFLVSTICVLGSCGVPRVVHKKRSSFGSAVIFYVLASSAKVSFAGEATAPSPDQSALVQIQDIGEHMNLRGSGEHYLDLSDDERVKILSNFATDAIDLFAKIELPDEDSGSGPDALRASSSLLSHLRDRVSDPLLMASLPHHAQSLFKSLTSEVSRAQAHVSNIESIVTSHYVKDKAKTGTSSALAAHRRLTSGRKLSASPNARVSWSDYHSRIRGRHLKPHELFDNQQGYHRARHSRNEGTHRRLGQDDEESYCIDVDVDERKTDQCLRLASCAKNYNIYDLFVFLFGDDIDFTTGTVDDKERIEAYDDVSLITKLNTIRELSDDIDDMYDDNGNLKDGPPFILGEGDLCDQLLQEFHRFDEDLSVKGKWQGGSVTGVCRGWGTNKFMSLEAIYHISDAVMSIRERVEHCLEELVDKFNTELETFTISATPCDDELKDPDGSDIEFFILTKAQVQADIQKKFGCLKYSYLVKWGNTTDDGDCVDYECDPDACEDMRFNPIFKAKDREGVGFTEKEADDVPNPYFDYELPAVVPRREERLSPFHPIFGFDFGMRQLGNFLVDFAPYREMTAEKFVVEVFNEYMGCANDIVKNLTGQLFDPSNGYNPYSPGLATQFQLPMEIKEATKDTHGHIEDTYLNKVFKYKPVGYTGGIDTTADPPELSDGLKDFLAEVYAIGQSTDESIKYYEDDCDGDHCDELAQYYRDKRDNFFDKGFDRSSLDTSIALFFGNKTTIGQVCSYARGLKEGKVEDVPGFCCLDAPYESKDWGEKFACTKYTQLHDGSAKVIQKTPNDCNRLGPVTTAFNEAACDIVHGTWCPTPRSCQDLVHCIAKTKEEVRRSRTRQAFYEYLDGAPEVKLGETDDPTKCGEVRTYFEYDADFPDDDRICNEVQELQCHTDFSNLDGFATGTAGAGVGMDELAVSESVALISKTPFDSTGAKTWRNSNFALRKGVQVAELSANGFDTAQVVCTAAISLVPGTSAACQIFCSMLKSYWQNFMFVLNLLLDISERIYSEVVDAQDADYEDDRHQTTYENVINNHNNIITTFYATQQLKVMLGEISDGIANIEEDLEEEEQRRRLNEIDCVNVTGVGWKLGCTNVTCEDPARLCDGSYNFPYIAYLKGAGCDDLDSDGDGVHDECEDRFPPEIVLRHAEIFRCDEDDTSRLCYAEKVFNNETHLLNFLHYQFPATDDCSPTNKLSVVIEYTSGVCRDRTYTLTPMQNISACDGREPVGAFNIPYENPLRGTPKVASVPFDDEAPGVECGFGVAAGVNKIDGKTLYHYMLKTDGSAEKLDDAGFSYNVTDNCEDDVQVNIVVKSNELQQNTIAELIKYNTDSGPQAAFLYAPTTCGNIVENTLCRENPANVRSYEITVSATDSAGNTGSDTCKVAIVSSCSPSSGGCKKADTSGGKPEDSTAENFYYTKEYVDSAIADEGQILYEVASADLVWEHQAFIPSLGAPHRQRMHSIRNFFE